MRIVWGEAPDGECLGLPLSWPIPGQISPAQCRANACEGTVKRYCIIGAGACGLAVAKTFAERGIPFDCFEALGDVGGLWNPDSPHVVYGSTYLNSSKKLSRYPDFHFPEEWAPYANRAQAQAYLRA